MVTLVVNVLLHVLLVASLLLFLIGIVIESIREPDPRERVLRTAALVAGALVTLGAQASGATFATFTVGALAGARPASAAAQVGATVIPGLLGAGIGFYIVRVFRQSNRLAMRIMGFLAMLAGTAFLQVYAEAAQAKGLELGSAALPNISFVAGVILCVVFTDNPDAKTSGGQAAALLQLLRRRNDRSADAAAFSATLDRPPTKRDPFAL